MKRSSWEEILHGNLQKAGACAFSLGIGLFPGFARTSDQVLPRTGQVYVAQIDQYLRTPTDPVPIARIFDQDQVSGILGPGWVLDLTSQLVESEGYLVLLAPSTGPILLVQEEEGGLYESSDGILARVNDDGWTVESPGGPTSLFDRLGKELSRRDANGNTITFSYDSRGFLSEVKAFDGQALRFTYDAKGLLTSIQGPSGRQCEYRYDATGRLTEAKEADGWTTGFAYSEGGRLSAIDYPSGERVRFNYDGSGRVAERASSTGVTYTYSYAAATRVSRQDGFWSETSYDKRGFPEKYRESTGREQSWGWNEEGQLETRTFLDGSSASYRYDLQGRLLRQETSRGDVLEIAYDGDRFLPVRTNFNGTVTQFEYDPNGNLLSMTSPAGRKTTYTYDAHGRRQSVTNGEGSTTRFTYDSVGDLIRQINPDGGAISFEYDSDGRIVREEDPVGRVTSYSYQANGLLQSVTDPLGDALSYEYDAHGRITKEVRPQNTVQYHYDERGFPAGIDFPDQTQIRVSHDALGNPTQVVDRFGTITKNEYDPLGRLVSTILPTGMPIGMSYDSSGRLQTMGHDTNTYRLAMDPGARETRLTDPAGGVTRLRHDQMDQVVQRISPGGGREQRKYDPDGLLESVTLPMGDTWEFSYDRAGQPLEILFPTGVRQQLSYDKAGRLAGIRYPGGQSIAYSYDPSGLLLEMTNARGQRVQYGYDPGGRFISKKTPEEDWHYRYDSAGHLVQATNGKFTLRYTYNGFGQLVQTEYVEWGKTIQYSRDKLGRIESRIDPDGNRTSYAYDRFGQISRIAHTGGAVFDFEYSREGRLTGRRNPNGTSTEYLYDPAGRINSVQHRNASGDVISSRTYRYDFDGNRVESTDEQGRGDTFQYDQEQKLTGEKGPWGWRSYVYGPGGQRISVSGPSSNVPYLYDDRGMLIEAGEEKFGYDPDGNLITRTGREGATLYSYDGEGNLTGIELPDGKRIAYGYGPFRERIWREEDGRRTYYLLDGSDAIQELSANLEPKATYLFGGLDQPLMVSFSDGETGFFHQDILGSILAISDSNQQVVARYSYDAFGRVLKEEGEIRQPLRFTGRPFDALTGLQDLRLRFYDPEHGRFLSMDPLPGEIDDPMSLSPYLYVRNNPLSYPDPFGLDPFWVPTPNARDMYGYFARDIGAFPPIWLEPEYVITPSARTNPLEVMKRIDEHADWLQEKFGANTAAGFRKRAMERWRGMIAGGAVRNLPQGSRTVGNVTPPSTGSSGSVLDGRTALAGQRLTAGSALSSARQWIPRTASSALDAVRGTSRVSTWGNWGMAAGDLIGETFDVPTMSFTDDAFRNMTSSARSLFIASGVGAAGGAVATYAAPLLSGAVGGALATGGAVAGAGMLVYGAGNRTYAAMQEANRMERAWRREAANQARAVNTEKIMSDRYLDDLNKLRAKSNELEALRPQIQGADAEIRSLELEIANKRNAVQAAHERLNGLAAQFRDADSKLRSETTPTGESRRDTRINALMNELQELKRKACEAAASVTGISDPAGKTRKLEEAKGYARGAAQKAEEISQLQGVPEPQGDSAETQEALRTMENTLLEMEESYSAIEADTRGIQERKDLIEGKWGPLERAWTLQAEILLNLNLRKNFSDPLGELAPLRESASRPLPPKEGLKELLQSAQDSFNQAKGLEDRGKRTVETARQFTNAAKNRLPSATSPGVSPAQDPALLVKEAQACVTEAERQASGTGSETGTGEATPRSTEEDGGFQSAGEGTTESSEEQTVSPDSFGPAGVGRTEEGSGVSLLSTDVMGQRPDFPTAEGEDETGGGFASAGAGQTAPGAVASAQPTSFQTTFTTTIAAGQPAAWHIFATGSRLGWAAGLGGYSVGPADASIIEHLQVAGEHAMWANRESRPPTLAWPGWSATRTTFRGWADDLARSRTNEIRRRIATSAAASISGLAPQLDYQTVGTTEPRPTCDAAYVRLGFELGYGAQVMGIADEAAQNGDLAAAQRARQDAFSHLHAAHQVLIGYEQIKVASGRCAELKDVQTRLERIFAMNANDFAGQAAAARADWELANERIAALAGTTAVTAPVPQPVRPADSPPIARTPPPTTGSTPTAWLERVLADPGELQGYWGGPGEVWKFVQQGSQYIGYFEEASDFDRGFGYTDGEEVWRGTRIGPNFYRGTFHLRRRIAVEGGSVVYQDGSAQTKRTDESEAMVIAVVGNYLVATTPNLRWPGVPLSNWLAGGGTTMGSNASYTAVRLRDDRPWTKADGRPLESASERAPYFYPLNNCARPRDHSQPACTCILAKGRNDEGQDTYIVYPDLNAIRPGGLDMILAEIRRWSAWRNVDAQRVQDWLSVDPLSRAWLDRGFTVQPGAPRGLWGYVFAASGLSRFPSEGFDGFPAQPDLLP